MKKFKLMFYSKRCCKEAIMIHDYNYGYKLLEKFRRMTKEDIYNNMPDVISGIENNPIIEINEKEAEKIDELYGTSFSEEGKQNIVVEGHINNYVAIEVNVIRDKNTGYILDTYINIKPDYDKLKKDTLANKLKVSEEVDWMKKKIEVNEEFMTKEEWEAYKDDDYYY